MLLMYFEQRAHHSCVHHYLQMRPNGMLVLLPSGGCQHVMNLKLYTNVLSECVWAKL